MLDLVDYIVVLNVQLVVLEELELPLEGPEALMELL